ncbi:MAG: DUF998 domain-containing protein [Candidatus Thermoplasmatota archaeon]|nr:DUF998 domain-containing protein [Candidatus Thermoplasmatota archaeon]
MKKFDLKLAGYCGILAPIAMLLLILIAISYSPFSWTANALSDLGVNGITAILFNSSLVVCGALIFIFALGLRKILANWLGNIAIIAFISTAIALCGIGLFPENMGIIHFYFSVAFFVLLPISLFFIGLSISAKDRKLGFVILILSICSALIWLLPKNGVAIHEFVASSAGSASCILLGIKLTRS